MSEKLKPKSVNQSKTILSELMVPSFANFGGKVHGGTILSMMDKIAYVCATKHAGNYCVTASVETVDFLSAVEVGDQLTLYASVNYVGKSSLIVGIKVVAEDIKSGDVRHTNTSYFTMVAMNEAHQSTPVPPLLLESREDVRRFLEAKKRKELKPINRVKYEQIKLGVDFKFEIKSLDSDNCVINIK